MTSLKSHVWPSAVLVALLLFPAAPAYGYELGRSGKVGQSSTVRGSCTYQMFPSNGVLTLGGLPPQVTGARARRGREWVRYRAYLVNTSERVLQTSGWSGWNRVSDYQWSTWTGQTFMSGHYSGSYYLDYRIEWWNGTASRRVGVLDLRISPYNYYNQYGAGPFGPLTWCHLPH
jgi:hypothetical protein